VAGSGKKLQGGGARSKRRSPAAQVSDGGFGRPPHPLRVMAGQVFFPRSSTGRRRLLEITHSGGEVALARRVESPREKLTISVARLLARQADGQGRFYSFQGYRSREYRVLARVAAVDGDGAVVVVPEWHPARPVPLAASALPPGARQANSWLVVVADLSAPTPARLGLSPAGPGPPPPANECPPVLWAPSPPPGAGRRPERGVGCGDVVLERPSFHEEADGRIGVFVPDRPEGLEPDARVYLPDPVEPRVAGFVAVEQVRVSPNGATLVCAPCMHELAVPVAFEGRREQGRWRWRWWPREAEHPDGSAPEGGFRDHPHEHRGGYVLQRGSAR
jgi:hypothetical protein